MQKLNILNTREVKKIREVCVRDYGYFPKEDFAYLQNEKGKVFLINKDLARIEIKKIRVDKLGLYFAEVKNNEVRLSKEGAQLIGKHEGLKNVVELNKEEMKKYFQGEDLSKDLGEKNRFVLLKYEEDIFGCAKYKEKNILNFLPKIHRGEVIL